MAWALGDIETADALNQRAQDLYDEQVRAFLLERAERRRAGLMEVAARVRRPEPCGEDPSGL